MWQHSKCHGIPVAQAEREDFHFVCNDCKRKEQEAKQPKLPPLKLRLTSASPSAQKSAQVNGDIPGIPPRRLDSVQVSTQRPPSQPRPQPVQPAQALLNGPSLSPRGQALGPPGIQRSEAAYGIPQPHLNGSSPVPPRPSSTRQPTGWSMANGYPTSSPPQYQSPQPSASPYNNYNSPYQQTNGSPYALPHPFKSVQNPPYGNSFSRPTSSASTGAPYQSPVKNSPAPSPKPANGIPNTYNFTNSPHSSFPPSSAQRPSFSPTKNSSPPPPLPQMSSPAPLPPRLPHSPAQMPAQVLPNPIPAPEKHDGARPMSSHGVPVLPPIKPLSPDAKPQILSPPTKKPSPTPERPQFNLISGNGYGGAQ